MYDSQSIYDINTKSGELEYYADGQPTKLVAVNYTSASDG